MTGGLYLGGSLSRGSHDRGSLSGGSLSRGVSVQGGLCPGGFCPGGLCPGVVSVQGGLYQGDPRTIMSGQYASYWNAFLFGSAFSNHGFQHIIILQHVS